MFTVHVVYSNQSNLYNYDKIHGCETDILVIETNHAIAIYTELRVYI